MKAIAARARLEPFPGEAYKPVARDPQAMPPGPRHVLAFRLPCNFASSVEAAAPFAERARIISPNVRRKGRLAGCRKTSP
jgi:hypothetical protein